MKIFSFFNLKIVILFSCILILIIAFFQESEVIKSSFLAPLFDSKSQKPQDSRPIETTKIVSEESVVIDVVNKSLPSVVTVGISTIIREPGFIQIDPFDPFDPFKETLGEEKTVKQNIGSGFIISEDGMIITNKHVVRDTDASYSIMTNSGEKYDVEKIYRDPLNDLAILKINAKKLTPLVLGSSSKLKLGQMVIAIGTPLGEFQNTVTTGVISGLGRGITAGSAFEGFVEKLDNVIQTDAAISPGNSGGPLLNSSAQVIGINTAIANQGQNIGFAIPVNVIKQLVDSFIKQGSNFERPYIGINYKMINTKTAIMNDVVAGAYVESVIESSPADKAGVKSGDIITTIDGEKLNNENEKSLIEIILKKKVGDQVELSVWRSGKIIKLKLLLEALKN